MGKITLSGALPAEGMNGLGRYSDEFMGRPREMRLVVALVSSSKSVLNHETGSEYPVLSIKHWELVADGDKSEAAKILANALAIRTGAVELPYEPGGDAPMKEPPFGDATAGDEDPEVRD